MKTLWRPWANSSEIYGLSLLGGVLAKFRRCRKAQELIEKLRPHYCCWPNMLAAHPLMYLVEEGQRIRCPVCQRIVTHRSSRKAIKKWNRQVRAKRRSHERATMRDV